jgi:hypothetical protein
MGEWRMKKLIGILMLLGVFASLFTVVALKLGVVHTAMAFGVAFLVTAVIVIASNLITSG